MTNIWVKSSTILCVFSSPAKIFLIFYDIFGYKKGRTTIIFLPSLLMLFLDPGWTKIRIRNKHPGSATLIFSL
jgi:hypothetical protein